MSSSFSSTMQPTPTKKKNMSLTSKKRLKNYRWGFLLDHKLHFFELLKDWTAFPFICKTLACLTAHGVFIFIGNHKDKRYPRRGSCMCASSVLGGTGRVGHAWFQVSSSIFFHSFFLHALSISVCIGSAAPSWPD